MHPLDDAIHRICGLKDEVLGRRTTKSVNFACPVCYSNDALFSGAAETCYDALSPTNANEYLAKTSQLVPIYRDCLLHAF
jgi:hypothetical protein